MAAIHQLPGAATEPVQQEPRKRAKYSKDVAILKRARDRRRWRLEDEKRERENATKPKLPPVDRRSPAQRLDSEVMAIAIFARGLMQTVEQMQQLLKGVR